MKKIRNTIVGILLFVLLAGAGLSVMHFMSQRQLEEVFSGDDITIDADEALLGGEKVRAPEADNALWLKQGIDFSLDSEDFSAVLKKTDTDFFSSVFISAETPDTEKLRGLASLFRDKGLKVYLSRDISFELKELTELVEICDGVFLEGTDGMSVDKLNSRLLKIRAAAVIKSDFEIFVSMNEKADATKFNKKSVDGVCFTLDEKTDAQALSYWDKVLSVAKTKLLCEIDFNSVSEKKTSADAPLRALYSVRELSALDIIVFNSQKAVVKNYSDSFSAVYKYINRGIVPELSLRQPGITGYNGEIIKADYFTKEIEIYGSDLFPFYLDGEKLPSDESGSIKVSLNLDEKKKSYTISQCGREIVYKVDYSFGGELIDSVAPLGSLSASPGEKVRFIAIAYSKAEITFRVGAKRYTAKPASDKKACFTAFVANIKMPSSIEEMNSLGAVTVIASYMGRSVQTPGPVIVPVAINEASSTTQKAPIELVGNYVPDIPDDAYEYTALPTVQQRPVESTTAFTANSYYTGGQMCVVTESYADTWPLIDNDDTYVPHYTALPYGTMDYVTGQSEAYNEDDNEQVYFYELSSGRKVKRDKVSLIASQSLPLNTMQALSSTANGATVTLKLSTAWRVPYDIVYTPQSYYSAYGKLYNVTSFTASSLNITFYHTASLSGNIDVSASDVFSSASVTPKGNSVTLTLPLKATGKYYGCSVDYDENGLLTITLHNKPQTLAGSVILLDPGHGGDDPGALGLSGAVYESNVNYALAYYTKISLESKGATVYLTRSGDVSVSLEQRKEYIRGLKPDLFVSVHCNASPKSEKIGTAVYYYKPFSFNLAENIYNNLLSVFRNNLYYGQSSLFGEIADGTMYYPFSVIRVEDCPAVLVETGYMTNDNECYKLISSENQRLLAAAIASGIEKTITG